jgi:hypothetical protein
MLMALRAEGLTFDGFKSGGLYEKYAVATWNLGTISELNYGDCRQSIIFCIY